MASDDDDFDDDEYRPPQRDAERGRSPVVLWVGLGLAALVIAGAAFFLVSRNRLAAERAEQALAESEAARALAEKQQQKPPFVVEKPKPNWEKVIGKWVREPGPQDKGGSPYRFEFRADQTARTIRTNFDGQPQEREGRVEILADENNRLMLRMEVPGGTISYTFHFRPDAKLVLVSGGGELLFTREK